MFDDEYNDEHYYDPYGWLHHKAIFYGVALLIAGWLFLAFRYPLAWAVVTAGIFVLGAGLLTTKIVLRLENVALMWALTPVFGLTWLLALYLAWVVARVIGI
jgi:hypothetical protein